MGGCAETIPVSPCAGLKPIVPSSDGYVIGSPEWQQDTACRPGDTCTPDGQRALIDPATITFDVMTPRTAGQVAAHNAWMKKNCEAAE